MKKITIFLVLTFLAGSIFFPFDSIASFRIKAETNETQSGSIANNLGLYGGQAEDIAADGTSDNVYLTTMAPNGFFISTDNGETFTGLPSDVNYGTGKEVEIDQTNGNVYVLIGDKILKSTNKGATFNDITDNLGSSNALGQKMVFADDNLLVANNPGPGSTTNIAVSANEGVTFTKYTIGDGDTINALAASPTTDTFYASISDNDSEKLYISTNGGTSWTDTTFHSKTGVPANQRISTISVDPADANHIVISDTNTVFNSLQTFDGGNTWAAITNGGQNIGSNHITFDGTRMYIGQSYSTDNGNTWTSMSTSTPLSSIYADKFAFDPDDINILFTNSNYGLAKSTDRGVTWQDKVNGVTSVKTYDIFQANNKGVVWIAANGGLAKTTNFTSSSPNWTYPVSGTGDRQSYAVWVNPSIPNIVLYGSAEFIKKSANGGQSWTNVAQMSAGGGNVQEIAAIPGNNNTLYAAYANDILNATDYGSVFKSTDGGDSWTNLNIPSDAPATSLTIARDGDVYAGASSRDTAAPKGIYKYSNGSWTKLTKGPNYPITSILADPDNANVIYATANSALNQGGNPAGSGLYKTTDGGSSWDKITQGLENVSNLDTLTVQTSTAPNTLYLAGQAQNLNGGIYKSADGGESWGLYYTGLNQESFYAMLFDNLVAGNDRGLYGYKSRAKLAFLRSKRVKKGRIAILKVSLVDSVKYRKKVRVNGKLKTIIWRKKLKKRLVGIYRKVRYRVNKSGVAAIRTKWVLVKRVRTGKRGTVELKLRFRKDTSLRARFVPRTRSDKAEYASVASRIIRIRVY